MVRSLATTWMALLLAGAGPVGAQADDHRRLPVPAAESIASSRKKVREAYAGSYENRGITRTLLAAVPKTQGATDRYALCAEALELAIGFRDPATAFRAIRHLDVAFDVDRIAMELRAMGELESLADTKERAAAAAEFACVLLDQCVAEDRYGEAERAIQIARSLATRSGDQLIEAVVESRVKRIAQRRAEYQAVAPQLELARGGKGLTGEQATAVARYLCFSRLDWAHGLPWLARSHVRELRRIAQLEVQESKGIREWMSLADQWWLLAKGETGAQRFVILQRAACWYGLVRANAAGFEKMKAAVRVEAAQREEDQRIDECTKIRAMGWKHLADRELGSLSRLVSQEIEFTRVDRKPEKDR